MEIYNKELILVISKDVDKSIEKLDKEHGCEYDDSIKYYAVTSTFSNTNGGMAYYITLPAEALTKDTIAHEAFHATVRILDHIGIDFNLGNQEPFAYLLEYLVREIHKCIDKYNK